MPLAVPSHFSDPLVYKLYLLSEVLNGLASVNNTCGMLDGCDLTVFGDNKPVVLRNEGDRLVNTILEWFGDSGVFRSRGGGGSGDASGCSVSGGCKVQSCRFDGVCESGSKSGISGDRVPDQSGSSCDVSPGRVNVTGGSNERMSGVSGVSSGEAPVVSVRGRHYQRNKRKRANKEKKNFVKINSPVHEGSGYFSACSDGVKEQLRDTRAEMLIAANKLKTQQSLAAVKEVQMLKDTRVNEVNFELKRLTLEQKLASISEKRGLTEGSVRTVTSSTISTSPPTLLSGSVSPNSSISMAEERKLRQSVVDQATELSELKEELVRLKAGVSKSSKKKVNVSEWTFKSPYDNFTADGVHKSKLPGYVRNGNDYTCDVSCVDGGQDFQSFDH